MIAAGQPLFVCDLCGGMSLPLPYVRWAATRRPAHLPAADDYTPRLYYKFWDVCLVCSNLAQADQWADLVAHVRLMQPAQTDLAVRLYLSVFKACDPVGLLQRP